MYEPFEYPLFALIDGAVAGREVYGIDTLFARVACDLARASKLLLVPSAVGKRCVPEFADDVAPQGFENCVPGAEYDKWSNATEPNCLFCCSIVIAI